MTTIVRDSSPILLLACIIFTLLPAPSMAAVEYLGGEPILTASLEGQNEYLPGSDAVLVVVIENRGTPEFKMFPAGWAASDIPSSTARLLRAGLGAGDAPVLIKNDPQMVGDLPAESRVEVPFQVKILQNASGGTYTLPLSIEYVTVSFAEQRGGGTLAYSYSNASATIPLPLKVTPRISIQVTDTGAGELTAGNEGFLTLSIRNVGSLAGNESIARILRHQDSPVLPIAGTSYIGEFPPGSSIQSQFKVQVNDQAQASTYPLDVVVEYLDPQGDRVTTDPLTIGIPVEGSIEFEILTDEFTLARGSTKEIEVLFKNTGPVTVRSAQARISAADPFSSEKDIASLGDMAPGEEIHAAFLLTVDKSATVKEYGLDTEVRYRDVLDNQIISDPMKIRVKVVERTGLEVLTGNPVYIILLVFVLIGIAYFIYSKKKSR